MPTTFRSGPIAAKQAATRLPGSDATAGCAHLSSFAELMNALPVAVWITDASGRVRTDNASARRICGAVESFADRSQAAGFDADSGEPLLDGDWPIQRALCDGLPTFERRLRCACVNGTERLLLQTAVPIRDAAEAIDGAILVASDITDLDEARRAHERGEALLQTVFDLLPVGVWVADSSGRIIMANPSSERIWRGVRFVPQEQFHAFKAWRLDNGKQIEADEWALARAVTRGETSGSELIRIECFDGSHATVINWAAPIRDASGKIQGGVAINEDVTVLQKTREDLAQAVHDREKLLAVVSHDLRNPLAALRTYAATAAMEGARLEGAERLTGIAQKMQRIADASLRLVEDLLSLSAERASGRSSFRTQQMPAALLLEQAVAQAQAQIEAAGLDLHIDMEPGLPSVVADPDRMQRVFANLLDNAVKHTERGNRVTLAAATVSAGVRFCIRNEGPALPREQIQQLFVPFWQAKDDRRGTGLGLSICREIVEAHGGTIWAEAASGERVRICFILPVSPLRH